MGMTMKAVLAPKLTSSNRLMGPWGALSASQIEEELLDNEQRPELLSRDVPADIANLVSLEFP